ncbi:50S ribosomal protein L19 [bacterium]|nr:50S ribosomal protein L19 [bacterium]MBU1598945.1 50S ribosomal protein L19 [bacterium]MBU2462164.1 50S ribosomal protein L19 [bacterium]
MISIDNLRRENLKKMPKFHPGDTLEVSTLIKEGDKGRIQHFSGIVIRERGCGISKTFTVRKVSYGVGIERTFPLYSPSIANIKLKQEGDVRRSKLYYLRERKGKEATRIKVKKRP